MGNPNRRPMTAEEYRLAQAKAMTERQLLDGILGTPRNPGIALALGWRGYHTHRGQHSPAGFPDLVLVRRGRLVFAELKRQASSAKTSPEQDAWLADLSAVADSVLDEVLAGDRYIDGINTPPPYIGVYVWRPLDLLDGIVEAVLK